MSSTWEDIDLRATAKYPFAINKPGYLRIIAGDKIHILKQTKDWYFAKNENTFKDGICPKSYVKLLSDGDFSLIDLECYEVLRNPKITETLNCVCDPTTEQVSMPAEYSTLVRLYAQAIQLGGKARSQEETQVLVKTLNALRKYLGIHADLRRSPNESIITTSDLGTNDLIENKTDSSANSFETSGSVTLTFNVTLNQTARIVPRIYSLDAYLTKCKLLNAPADIYHEASEKAIEHKVTIPNLDNKASFILEVRVMNHKKFGTADVKGTWGNEYIGIGADFIVERGSRGIDGCKQPLEMDEFGSVLYDMQLYLPTDSSSPHNVFKYALQNLKDKLQPAPEISKISVEFEFKKHNTEAFAPDGEATVHALKESSVITPSYHSNSIFFHLVDLKHKTAKKRTRIVLHVLDFVQKKFIKECFERTKKFNNGDYFASVVEKGNKDFYVDEMTTINLDGINPVNCCVLIEVQRTSRSKGTIHRSSYGFHFLVEPGHNDPKIQASNDLEKGYDIFLEKPPDFTEEVLSKCAIERRDLLAKINNLPEAQKNSELKKFETETSLQYFVRLNSTKYSNIEGISCFIKWDDVKKEHEEDALAQFERYISTSSSEVPRYFFSPVLRVLALGMKNPKFADKSTNKYQDILIKFDRDVQRHPEIMLFYKDFVERVRTEDELAGIHVTILEFLNKSIPPKEEIEKIEDPVKKEQIAKIARSLPYFLPVVSASVELSKSLNLEADINVLTNTLRDLAEKIRLIFKNANLQMSHIFLSTVYQLICDIILDTFKPKEAAELIKPLIECCCGLLGPKTHQVRMKTAGIKGFTTPEIHHELFETFVSTLDIFKDKQIHTFFALVPLLFSTLKYTDDMKGDLCTLYKFSERLMYDEDSTEYELKPSNIDMYTKKYLDNFKDILDKNSTNPLFKSEYKQIKTMHEVNPYFLLLLVYHGGDETFEMAMKQRKNQAAFFWKFFALIRVILEEESIVEKPEFFFICLPAVLNVLSVLSKAEFKFLLENVLTIIDWINIFYKLFLKKTNKLDRTDFQYYQRVYPIDLKSLAVMLPSLLKLIPEEGRFIPSILVPFFHFYLSTDDIDIKKEISDGFSIIVKADYHLHNSLENSSNATMDALNSTSNDETVQDKLLDLVTLIKDAGKEFTDPVFTSFFDRAKTITQYMHDINTIKSDAQHEIQKTTALLSILESTLSNNDTKLFLHFSSILYELHMQLKNSVEAAETLYYTASQLKWDDQQMIAEGHDQPAQHAWERKRDCLLAAIPLYKSTFFYENGLKCVEELKNFFLKTYDYDAMEKLCLTEKELYDGINAGQRPPLSNFYGIRFYDDFENVYRNKIFVFCCNFTFNANKVITQYKSWFPNATVSNKPPEVPEKAGEFIHVFNIIPKVDDKILDINEDPNDYLVRHKSKVNKFYSQVPITKKRKDRSLGESAESYILEEEFETSLVLESYVRHAEAKLCEEKILKQPIECAIEQVRGKAIEIFVQGAGFYRNKLLYDECDQRQLSSFMMILKGVADAGVNGGIAVYLNTFFGDNDFAKEEFNVKTGPELRDAIIDQIRVLRWGLSLHNALVESESAVALGMSCVDSAKKMISIVKESIGEFDIRGNPSFGKLPSLSFLIPDENDDDF